MPSVPITSVDHSYLIDANGEYVVADTTTPNGPLVTDRPSLTSNARHVVTRAGNTVVAASSGRDIYTRGGLGPLVTDRPSLIVQPFPGGVTVPPVVVPPTITGGYSLGLLLTLTTAGSGAPVLAVYSIRPDFLPVRSTECQDVTPDGVNGQHR